MTQMHAARARSRQHTTPRRYRVAGPASGISLAWAWFISEKVPLTYPLFVCVGKRGGGEGGGGGYLSSKTKFASRKRWFCGVQGAITSRLRRREPVQDCMGLSGVPQLPPAQNPYEVCDGHQQRFLVTAEQVQRRRTLLMRGAPLPRIVATSSVVLNGAPTDHVG